MAQKHNELGSLNDAAGSCWRHTDYTYSGLSTGVIAHYTGTACSGDVASLDMHRTYDAAGQLRQTVDAGAKIVDYWFDGAGNPYMVQDAQYNVIRTEFNDLGRKTRVIDPNMGTKTYQYNAYGEVVFSQDGNQAQVNSGFGNYTQYDSLGRVVKQSANTTGNIFTGGFTPNDEHTSYVDGFDYAYGNPLLQNTYRDSNENNRNILKLIKDRHCLRKCN